MNAVDKATQTQLQNIQHKTGKSLAELETLVRESGLSKHGQIRDLLMRELGLGYGDANTLAHFTLKAAGDKDAQAQTQPADVLDEIYSGAKASLRPIHERLMEFIQTLGEFEVAPKKGYVSLRRKKQFAMIGPATNTRVEVGINHKVLDAHPRLIEQAAGSMCNYKVILTQAEDVDGELTDWIRKAYDYAG